MLNFVWHAIKMAFFMFWQIYWALILGFLLSAFVQSKVPKEGMSRWLPDASIKSLLTACAMGIASSSCSYAAVALTRSIIRKGANFAAAMGFQIASTNLVIELGIIMAIMLGWQFTVAEFIGGFLLVMMVMLGFQLLVSEKIIQLTKKHIEEGEVGKMESHVHTQMMTADSFTAMSHYFMMDVVAIWKDIFLGLLIAGALAAWVPAQAWNIFFLQSHPSIATFWGPFIGPLLAIFSFVCSVGNVPLAVVLWNGGISFGGVLAFIYADLIVIPILDIYRKYYGFKMAAIIFGIYYFSMVISALIVEGIFKIFHWVPVRQFKQISEMTIHFNYTAVLNIIFSVVLIIFVYRFFASGGGKMMKMVDHSHRCH